MSDGTVNNHRGMMHRPGKAGVFSPAYLKLYQESESFLKQLLIKNLPSDSQIFLFGSRATGVYSKNSDIDIGIIANNIDEKTIIKLKEIIDESFVPFKVDIVDFSSVDDGFKKEALKSIVQWK